MEKESDIHNTEPSLNEMFKQVMDEEYSAFFMCTNEFTAGVIEQAASENSVGRAELLHLVAHEAANNTEGTENPFLVGELIFLRGMQPQMNDAMVYRGATNNSSYWYIRLSRPDRAYLTQADNVTSLVKCYPYSVFDSLKIQ